MQLYGIEFIDFKKGENYIREDNFAKPFPLNGNELFSAND
jgi:hypothetical protein